MLPRAVLNHVPRHAARLSTVAASATAPAAIETTLALVKPGTLHWPQAHSALEAALAAAREAGLEASRVRVVPCVTAADARRFYAEHEGKFFFRRLVDWMSSGQVIAIQFEGPNAIAKWRELIGPTRPVQCKNASPEKLRALFGLTDTRNAFHGSDSPQTAASEIAFWFDGTFGQEE